MDVEFSDKYEPLFRRRRTRYIIVKGGRGSGKSFALASSTLLSTYDDGCNILYTRYTMTSAEVSIVPEYAEKVDLFASGDDFHIKLREVTNIGTGGTIFFRGLMQSSKNQIAKLKSIHNVKTWILDEAQELMDESLFDTIDLSVRTTEAANCIVIVFNPTDVQHWLYRRFFVEAGVDEDFNGVKGDVTYISTTYLDNLPNLSESFLAQAERMQRVNPDKYDNIFLGHFLRRREGLIYRRWQRIGEDEWPDALPQWYGIDWGYGGDPAAVLRLCFDPLTRILYARTVVYATGMLPRTIAAAIIRDAQAIGYEPEYCTAYCDPARPEARDELRIHYGIDARSAVNRDKPARVAWLSDFEVRYIGDEIEGEVTQYSYKPNPQDRSTFTSEPQDGNDHAMDAANYGFVSHLRYLGVVNDVGEK